MTATQDAPAAAGAGNDSKDKDYRIRLTAVRLDLTDLSKVAAQLKKLAGKDDSIVVDVVVADAAKGVSPKDALKKFGADNDLDGDYDVVAARNVMKFGNVKTAQKRDVSIG